MLLKPEEIFKSSVPFNGYIVGLKDPQTEISRGQTPDYKRNKKQPVAFCFDEYCLLKFDWLPLEVASLIEKEMSDQLLLPVEVPEEFLQKLTFFHNRCYVAPMPQSRVEEFQEAMKEIASKVKKVSPIKFRAVYNLFSRLSTTTPKTPKTGRD